jgi:hypothetical protein
MQANAAMELVLKRKGFKRAFQDRFREVINLNLPLQFF